ncbi:MAG: hypothetical protein NT098_02775 [Candidatus Parcubacteria bacterium]|nr:hypothetical protein [Candidatus Parcubacteria bacterium]
MRNKSWTKEQLILAVKKSKSVRSVIKELGLVPAGGNYEQIKRYITEYNLNTKHFTGMTWNKGMRGIGIPRIQLSEIRNHHDNRLENLRILCPNCHSLKPTHRGLNKNKKMPEC